MRARRARNHECPAEIGSISAKATSYVIERDRESDVRVLHSVPRMTRRFTDRDGVEWRVECTGGTIAGVFDEKGDEAPLTPGGLHFRSDTDGFFLEMSYINPKHLTEPELQMMIDDRATD